MANVVGEHFFKYTDDQVKQRQKIYAKRDRDDDDLAYMNGKTAWLKLVSSINIDQEKYRELSLSGGNLSENRLASDLVLFGGTTPHITENKKNSIVQLKGISSIDSLINNAAYGLGGDDFGKRPMPGIISAQVKPKNRGSLREATIQIKAYNKGQLDLLDAIYLRIGYTMLLEWGWSNYYDNEGTYQSNPNDSLAWDFLNYSPKKSSSNVQYLKYGINSGYWKFLNKIENNRKVSCGNYDAMLGKVANFSWEFGNDGTYDITLKLISVGDVVESLKINLFSPVQTTSPTSSFFQNSYVSQVKNIWAVKYFKNDIGKHIWDASSFSFTYLPQQYGIFSLVGTTYSYNSNNSIYASTNSGNPVLHSSDPTDSDETEYDISLDVLGYRLADIYNDDLDIQLYYRFGDFLKYIEENLLLYADTDTTTPIISIDHDTDSNFMFHVPNQISTFPNKCIIGGINYTQNNNNVTLFPGCKSFIPPSSLGLKHAGLLMNVYLNCDHILELIDSNTNPETGDLSLYDFLKAICDSINDSLGNYNRIEPVLDEDRLYFIDQTPLTTSDNEKIKKGLSNYNHNYAVIPTYFNPYGIGPNGGSLGTFVKKFSIKTELTNDFATIVTVGAQANGRVVGEDATALSKWNKGLKDRIIPVKFDKLKTNQTSSSLNPNDIQNIKDRWAEIINDYLDTDLRENDNDIYTSDKKVMRAYIDYTSPPLSENIGLGFIPINLNLTCEGISGPKIYQQFSINTDFLPKKYPESLKFLIKGITHNIQNNIWETTFDSLSIPENISATTLAPLAPLASFAASPPSNQPQPPPPPPPRSPGGQQSSNQPRSSGRGGRYQFPPPQQ